MKTYRIVLKPIGIIRNFPASDTLFGAICWGIRQLYGEKELECLLEKFDTSDKKFILSSTFPLLIAQEDIPLYPNPAFPDPEMKEMEELAEKYREKIICRHTYNTNIENELQFSKKFVDGEYKRFRKANYISSKLFQRLMDGGSLIGLFEEYLNSNIKMIDRLLITKDEYEKIKSKGKIFDSRVTLKNKIDRLSLSTALSGEIYYEEEVYLNPEVFNLYFFIMTKDIEFFAPVFHWLSDTGIGGERTIGRGHYKIENEGEYPIPGAKNGASFITLSRYLPKNDEVNWKGINYYEFLPYHSRFDTMFLKGGEFLKRKFIYLKEGAILSFRKKREYYGMLYQVAEFQGKTIYQNGLTIPVFAKVGRRCK